MSCRATPTGAGSATRSTPDAGTRPSERRRPAVGQHPELQRAVARDRQVADRFHRQEAAAALGGRDQCRLGIRTRQHHDHALERPVAGCADSEIPSANASANPATASPRQRRGSTTTATSRSARAAQCPARQAPGARESAPRRAAAGDAGRCPPRARRAAIPIAAGRTRSPGPVARVCASRRRAAGPSVPSAYAAARASRRADRSGRARFMAGRSTARSPRRRGTS